MDMNIEYFDPTREVVVTNRPHLPHWSQEHVPTFITWRTWDSIPKVVAEQWQQQRDEWLREHSIEPNTSDWYQQLQKLAKDHQVEYRRRFTKRWENLLDCNHGECVLKNPSLSKLIADSLHHFDSERYDLFDYVVMPNHVHVLASFHDNQAMLAQVRNWKHYTAKQVNGELGRTGRFWATDGFDHLVRSPEQLERIREYIQMNPQKAGLREGEYRHYTNVGHLLRK
jgi:putative transposase